MTSGYQQARESAAFDERLDRGRVRLTGADGAPFLHALLTNDVESILPGGGTYAALLTPQGRMVSDMTVLREPSAAGPATILLIVPADLAAPLTARLDRAIFSEDVAVADVSGATAQFSVAGPQAAQVLDAALIALGYGAIASALARPYQNARVSGLNEDALVWRSDELDVPAFEIAIATAHAGALRDQLSRHAAPLSAEARTVLRVEAGRAEFHADMTTDTIPLEANLLDRAISTTKGCYVGQEVIVRVLHRGGGRVAKRLMRLRFDGAESQAPKAGDAILHGERNIGKVTSAVWSPRDRALIGLGYIHRDFVDPDEASEEDDALLTLSDGRAVTIAGE